MKQPEDLRTTDLVRYKVVDYCVVFIYSQGAVIFVKENKKKIHYEYTIIAIYLFFLLFPTYRANSIFIVILLTFWSILIWYIYFYSLFYFLFY